MLDAETVRSELVSSSRILTQTQTRKAKHNGTEGFRDRGSVWVMLETLVPA